MSRRLAFRSAWSCALLALGAALAATARAHEPEPPTVPFGNQPCRSLDSSDHAALKMFTPVHENAFRAPSTLKLDNVCDYDHANQRQVQVAYMTKGDYDLNRDGNRSTEKSAPADLPGAFYDKQGGLWFAKNGYYVVVVGRHALREPAARAIAAKL